MIRYIDIQTNKSTIENAINSMNAKIISERKSVFLGLERITIINPIMAEINGKKCIIIIILIIPTRNYF